jgi:hypothetical protein
MEILVERTILEHGGTTNEEIDALIEHVANMNKGTKKCPYCETIMKGPEQYYDDPTGRTKRWVCPDYGAAELHSRIPPEGAEHGSV